MNAHAQIKVAKAEIGRVLSILALCPGLDGDEQWKLSTLEGETDLNEIVSALLAGNEEDEGLIDALKAQIEVRKERKGRIEARIEARRNAIISLLDCARLTKLPLPEATVSVRTLPPSPKVAEEDKVPHHLCKTILKPNMDLIREAVECGQVVPGVVMTNGGAALTVRRK